MCQWIVFCLRMYIHVWSQAMSHVSYEWVMSHMNESCLIWMSHVSYEWVMSHMNKSYLTRAPSPPLDRRSWLWLNAQNVHMAMRIYTYEIKLCTCILETTRHVSGHILKRVPCILKRAPCMHSCDVHPRDYASHEWIYGALFRTHGALFRTHGVLIRIYGRSISDNLRVPLPAHIDIDVLSPRAPDTTWTHCRPQKQVLGARGRDGAVGILQKDTHKDT